MFLPHTYPFCFLPFQPLPFSSYLHFISVSFFLLLLSEFLHPSFSLLFSSRSSVSVISTTPNPLLSSSSMPFLSSSFFSSFYPILPPLLFSPPFHLLILHSFILLPFFPPSYIIPTASNPLVYSPLFLSPLSFLHNLSFFSSS